MPHREVSEVGRKGLSSSVTVAHPLLSLHQEKETKHFLQRGIILSGSHKKFWRGKTKTQTKQ